MKIFRWGAALLLVTAILVIVRLRRSAETSLEGGVAVAGPGAIDGTEQSADQERVSPRTSAAIPALPTQREMADPRAEGPAAAEGARAAPSSGAVAAIPKNEGGIFAVDKATVQREVDRQLGPLLHDCYRDLQTRRPGMELDTTLSMQLTWMTGSGFVAHSPDIDDASSGDADFADCARQSIATLVLPFDVGEGPDQLTIMVPMRFRTRRPGDAPP